MLRLIGLGYKRIFSDKFSDCDYENWKMKTNLTCIIFVDTIVQQFCLDFVHVFR